MALPCCSAAAALPRPCCKLRHTAGRPAAAPAVHRLCARLRMRQARTERSRPPAAAHLLGLLPVHRLHQHALVLEHVTLHLWGAVRGGRRGAVRGRGRAGPGGRWVRRGVGRDGGCSSGGCCSARAWCRQPRRAMLALLLLLLLPPPWMGERHQLQQERRPGGARCALVPAAASQPLPCRACIVHPTPLLLLPCSGCCLAGALGCAQPWGAGGCGAAPPSPPAAAVPARPPRPEQQHQFAGSHARSAARGAPSCTARGRGACRSSWSRGTS